MSKIKVLYIITKQDVGGAQKYTRDLVNNLDKNIFETKILFGGQDIYWLIRDAKPWLFFLPDWLAIFELVKVYKREKPNLIHLNSSKAGFLGSLAAFLFNKSHWSNKSNRTNAKVIFTAHGWVFNPTNAVPPLIRWFYVFLHKIAAFFQDKIICVSEYDHNLALSYGIAPKEKLAVIHNGINPNMKFLDKETARKEILMRIRGLSDADMRIPPSSITKSAHSHESASSTYNLHHRHYDWPWVGSIGRLVKEKNYETLIQAAALTPNTIFFIIGEGYEKNNCQLLITNYQLQNRFFLIKPTGNDAQYLRAFDIFVMSSIKEGLPYILLEAMLAGLPIVVTEAGGMPEVIKNHENGLMVSQKNPEFMAKTIQGLLNNPNIAKELGEASKQAVTEKFNLKKMILETSRVYSEELIV